MKKFILFIAGTRHPPSEDSDYDESIINVTSLYPGSEEVVKLTNFLEEMKSQQDSEDSKGDNAKEPTRLVSITLHD